jgi:hypothetical protein
MMKISVQYGKLKLNLSISASWVTAVLLMLL